MNRDSAAPDDAAAPRVLLLGASGRLGTALTDEFTRRGRAPGTTSDVRLVAPARAELALDPSRPLAATRGWFERWQPRIVVNCIAMSDVDRCEREKRAARELNADLPGALARTARERGAHLIHFSTDFVFDGTLRRPYREDDAPNPLSVYGSTKLAGETAIEAEKGSHWIFRVSWLYGGPHRNLAAVLLDASNAGRNIALADDRVGVPNPVALIAREVAEAIGRVRDAKATVESGVYHLSCHGATTWYEFGRAFVACAIASGRIAAERAPRIEAFAETPSGRPARRPAWSVLDSSRYESAFGRILPSWRDAIAFALQ